MYSIIVDHPSFVTTMYTFNRDHPKVSKLYRSKLGLIIPLLQMKFAPINKQSESDEHTVKLLNSFPY